MQTRRQGLRYLRQVAASAEGSRLDAELLERFVASNDQAAFTGLVERHGPLVMRVCRRVLRNHHDAEDVFQATFLVLARKARDIRQRDSLAGWLYRVAYRLAVKHRAAARRQAERQPLPARPREAEDQAAWGDLRTVLDEELDRLPERYRTPLRLCCLAGCTRDEAARRLGCTLGALKMRLEHGRQLLRTRLARRGVAVPGAFLAPWLFAAGRTSAALSPHLSGLAELGLAAGAGKELLFGVAAVLMSLVGMAVGLRISPHAS